MQLTLDQILRVKKLSHRTDPLSSRLAAREAVTSGLVETHHAMILRLLKERPNSTCAELAQDDVKLYYQISRWMKELSEWRNGREPLIERGEMRICKVSKRWASTWRIRT